jgi:hypothetical protein
MSALVPISNIEVTPTFYSTITLFIGFYILLILEVANLRNESEILKQKLLRLEETVKETMTHLESIKDNSSFQDELSVLKLDISECLANTLTTHKGLSAMKFDLDERLSTKEVVIRNKATGYYLLGHKDGGYVEASAPHVHGCLIQMSNTWVIERREDAPSRVPCNCGCR